MIINYKQLYSEAVQELTTGLNERSATETINSLVTRVVSNLSQEEIEGLVRENPSLTKSRNIGFSHRETTIKSNLKSNLIMNLSELDLNELVL